MARTKEQKDQNGCKKEQWAPTGDKAGWNKPPGLGVSSCSSSLRPSPILSEDQECPSLQQPDGRSASADSGTADTDISQRAQKELPVGPKKTELACNLSLHIFLACF